VQSYDELVRLVNEVRTDLEKAEAKGNRAAGTRVRKSMQDIKKAAQAVREEVLKLRTTTEEQA
jgi:hypothetical protein